MKTCCRANQPAKFSIDELENADGSLMSRSNHVTFGRLCWSLTLQVCRSGTTREPLIRLVGVLTTINPLPIHHYIG